VVCAPRDRSTRLGIGIGIAAGVLALAGLVLIPLVT